MRDKSALLASAVSKSFTVDEIGSFIHLFKIVPDSITVGTIVPSADLLKKGILFATADGGILEEVPKVAAQEAIRWYGTEAELFNQTFYRSFTTVKNATPTDLLLDQILHYISTYGAEAIGVKIPAYIPVQALEIPEKMVNKKNFRFTVIQIVSANDAIIRFNKYLTTLIAPSPMIKESVSYLLPFTTIDTDTIKSFEIQAMQHDLLGTVPKHPISFLRYLVFRTTGETLLIKNKYLREKIKNAGTGYCSTYVAFEMLSKAEMPSLASIFLRYKPIFLAFKTHPNCAPIINRLRRLAEVYHAPLQEFSLQTLTSAPLDKARVIINKASNRDLIKVLNSIRTTLIAEDLPKPAVYTIRNGRTFVKENGIIKATEKAMLVGRMVRDELITRLRQTIEKKTFYLPTFIDYAAPTSEKQFIGNIPFGTRIDIDPTNTITMGIHWLNQGQRIDLDLHMNSETRHFGWNGSYTDGKEVIYTGDQTDAPAPQGAVEAFWFKPTNDETFILGVNQYSGPGTCDYKFFMTADKPNNYNGRKYTFDPNKTLFPAIPLRFNGERSNSIGMVSKSSFYFYGGTLSNNIVPSDNYADFINGLAAQLAAKVTIGQLITFAGGILIESIEDLTKEELTQVISLAPEDLTSDTLFNIIDGNE